MLNEADTRAKLIDPKLYQAGWREDLIEREFYLAEGRIEIVGDEHKRGKKKKADYVLRNKPYGLPLAIVEAKTEIDSPLAGMQQAKEYAEMLGAPFAYSTNGHEIEEFTYITHKQKSLLKFSSPDKLFTSYFRFKSKKAKEPSATTRKVLTTPYCSEREALKLRYYQEAAVQKVLEAILNGRRRVLLTMATGTGKTLIAFNIVWKLVKSGYLRRVLFLADRNFLRNQAYNVFSPFGDARAVTEERKTPKTRDIYFSIYQAMYGGNEERRVYQQYPPDFFDLIIIDECHRSGFGTWHDILKHFTGAIHLGMTATPKRDDNIDTYAYFGKPVYTYSFGAGVQDGFLAPFLVHRVLTNIDKDGQLSLQDARTQGAEIIYSEEEEPKDIYEMREFEKTITLPDRTKKMSEHLAGFLRTFSPLGRTMVFCVSMDHAGEVAKEMQNQFAKLKFDDYAVRIVSEDGDIRQDYYEKFRDSDKTTPVVATTVDLLTTGVDVPSAKNIVLMKPIASKVVFKQIIGRGSRIDPITEKYFFRIIDFVGATRLFDDWEKPPEPPKIEQKGPSDRFLSGIIVDEETQIPIKNALVTLQIAPNKQEYRRTKADGRFSFSHLPRRKLKLFVSATGYKKRQLAVEPFENPKEFMAIELRKKRKGPKKVKVTGLPVHIAEEETVVLEKDGKTLKVEEYIEYSKDEVVKRVASVGDLAHIWTEHEKRQRFLDDLKEKSVYPELLAQLLKKPEADTFDLLSAVAFGAIPLTRDGRYKAFLNRQQEFLSAFDYKAREVLLVLMDKYRLAGIEEVVSPKVFELPPFDKMGYINGVINRFKGIKKLKSAINQLERRMYLQTTL